MIAAYACCFPPIQYGSVSRDYVTITVTSGRTGEYLLFCFPVHITVFTKNTAMILIYVESRSTGDSNLINYIEAGMI